jgi:hypothetical protein
LTTGGQSGVGLNQRDSKVKQSSNTTDTRVDISGLSKNVTVEKFVFILNSRNVELLS